MHKIPVKFVIFKNEDLADLKVLPSTNSNLPPCEAGRFDIDTSLSPGVFAAVILKGEKHSDSPCEDYVYAQEIVGRIAVAVLDGAGGGRHASEMSYKAAMIIRQTIRDKLPEGSEGSVLKTAFYEANEEVRDENMGYSTATAAIIDPTKKQFHLAWSGNTRAYHISGSDVRMLTTDGGVGSFQFEMLGVKDDLRVEVKSFTYKPGDSLLICTDGIHERLSDTELKKIITSNNAPNIKLKNLIAAANTQEKKYLRDDQSAIILNLN
jgi:PPM family protein phosphatase